MGAVHLLPGTTFSNVKIKGDYDSEDRATFTLRELEKWIALEIVGKYHQRIHASLLRPPLAVWRERQGEVDFDLPPDRMAFWTSFLPGDRRRLLKDGIHLEKIRYWSDALSRDVGRGAVSPARRFLLASRNSFDQLLIQALGDPFATADRCNAVLTA